MRLQNRRRRHHTGHRGKNCRLILVGKKVVVLHLLRADCAAARVLDLNLIGADLLNLVQDELPPGQADRDNQNDRRRSDHHAQRRQREPQLIGAETVERQLEDLTKKHGAARAQERFLE